MEMTMTKDETKQEMDMMKTNNMDESMMKKNNFLDIMKSTLSDIHSRVVQAKVDLVDAQNTEGAGYNYLTEKNRMVNRFEGKEEMLGEIIDCYITIVMN